MGAGTRPSKVRSPSVPSEKGVPFIETFQGKRDGIKEKDNLTRRGERDYSKIGFKRWEMIRRDRNKEKTTKDVKR